MLNKKNRLTKRGSFSYLYRKGESKSDSALVLIFVKNKAGVRAGFSVSNKLGKATKRNKIKRRLRCAFGQYLDRIAPSQLVLVAKQPILDLSYAQIASTIEKLLQRAGLLIC